MENRDIQATHGILQLLEESKSKTEDLFDVLPGVFAILDQEGRILRGNRGLAGVMGLEHEAILGMPFESIFSADELMDFRQRFWTFTHDRPAFAPSEFELSVKKGSSTEERHFVWEFSHFSVSQRPGLRLFRILGKDVTELKRRLAEVVSLTKDLEVTAAIQALLLPKESVINGGFVNLAAYYESAEQSGGDWWWCDRRPDGSILAVVGDVTGHGVGSAMVTAVLASSYNTLNIMRNSVPELFKPERIFDILNTNLIQACGESYWISLTAVEMFPKQKLIKIWNAGGPPVLLRKADGTIDTITSKSLPLGYWPLTLALDVREMDPGDRILLFSDGVYDFDDTTGTPFRSQKLKRLFQTLEAVSAEEARNLLVSKLADIRGGNPLHDDATFVIIDRKS